MGIVIVIQARMSSSRLPGKVLLPLLGQSLLARMVERVRRSKYPIRIVIATSTQTEDNRIEAEAEALGVACFRGSLTNLLERHYQAAVAFSAGVVLKIPSDCPLIDPAVIDQGLDLFFESDQRFDYVSNLHPPSFPDGNDVEIMRFECLERCFKQAVRPLELEHTTPYIWENPEQFHIGNFTWNTGLDYSMSHRFTIDYPEDYHFIRSVFETLYPENPQFSCLDVVRLLEQRPDIYELNAAYAGVNWYRHHLDELKTIHHGMTKQPTGF